MRYLRIITIAIFLVACTVLGWTLHSVSQRDTVAPQIQDAEGTLHLKAGDDSALLLRGLTAWDDRDGDLTHRIIVERVSRFSTAGVCRVSYVVFDNSRNFVRYSREVIFDDYQPPRLRLDKPLMYYAGESITVMDRLHLEDCLDGDITHKLKLESSTVSESVVGIYEVEVRATSNYGDEVYAKVPLNITEYSAGTPQITLTEYLVYLKVGTKFNPLSIVESVTDHAGNHIPLSELKVVSQVDMSKPGGGQIRLEATDDRGITGITYLTVIVEEAE